MGKGDSAPCPQPSLVLWSDPPFAMVTWKPKDKGEPGRSQEAQLQGQESLCWITTEETQLRKGHLPYPCYKVAGPHYPGMPNELVALAFINLGTAAVPGVGRSAMCKQAALGRDLGCSSGCWVMGVSVSSVVYSPVGGCWSHQILSGLPTVWGCPCL